MTPAELRAHAESEAKKFGPRCQRHGSDVVLALLDVAEAASDVDRALKRHDDGDFSLEYEFELDNAWERLRAALAKLETPC